LKIETQFLDDHQARLVVELEPEKLDEAKRRAARAIAKKTKIPGFRPGKAPYHIIERFAGEEAIFEDALEIIVQEIYPKAIDEVGIEPYGPGKLENIPSRDPLTFEFVIPLRAKVELSNYRELRLPYEPPVTSDEDADRILESMASQQAVLEPVERPAQEGDLVHIRINAERLNPTEDLPAELIREMSAPIVIEPAGSRDPEEYPFPGFSQELVNMKEGDEKTVTYTYLEDSRFEPLRGTEAEFKLKVESIKSRQLPELSDEFATTQGDFESLEEMRAEIRTRLQERATGEYDQEYTDRILDQIVEASTIKFPPQMVEDEIDSLIHDLGHRLERQNMDIETYLKTRDMDMPALREELREPAENRLKRLLVLFEIGKLEDIQVESSEVQQETIQTLSRMYDSMPEAQANRQITSETVGQLANSVTADLMVRKSLDRLRDIASGRAEAAEAEAASKAEVEAAGAEQAEPAEAEVEVETAQAEAARPEQGESPEAGAAQAGSDSSDQPDDEPGPND
jgi:trigger factor